MRKLYIILSLLSCISFANNMSELDGNISGSGMKYDSVVINGSFNGQDVTVSGDMQVNGSMHMALGKVNKLEVNGSCALDSVLINGNMDVSGNLSGKNLTIQNKENEVSGSLTLDKSNVIAQLFKIDGSATINNSTINSVTEINGSLTSQNDKFNKSVAINGSLGAKDSSYAQGVNLNGLNAEILNSSVMGDIKNKYSAWFRTPEIIIDGSGVNGDIIFLKSKGRVILKNNAKVQGKIINATVEKS